MTSAASTIRTRVAIDVRDGASSSALERVGRPDEHHAEIEMTRRGERAVDDARGRVVAAHRVDGDPDHRQVLGARC